MDFPDYTYFWRNESVSMRIDVATWIIFPGKNPECDPVLSFQMRKMKTQVNHQPFHNITKIQLNCDKRWQKDDQHSVLFPQLSSSNRLAAAQESSGEILMTSLKPPENWSLQLSKAALIQFAGCFFQDDSYLKIQFHRLGMNHQGIFRIGGAHVSNFEINKLYYWLLD